MSPDTSQAEQPQPETADTPETADAGPSPSPEILGEAPAAEAAAEEAAAPEAGTSDADRIAELEAQVAELNDKLMRSLAEQENVRRRAQRDKQDASKYAISGFARDILAVADNLRRAIDSADDAARKAAENLVVGVEMTERQLIQVFEQAGITQINPMGERFDSKVHEAMFEIPDESQPQGTVAQVLEVGYILNDRLLRPAKVGVTKGGPKPETAAQTAPDDAAQAAQPGGAQAYENDGPAQGGKVDQEL